MNDGVIEELTPRLDLLRAAPRLCLFANYHPANVIADYVLLYLRDVQAAGFRTLVVSTSSLPEAEQSKLVRCCDGLLLRENVGLDIGSWIDACMLLFPIQAELLLLCNDSVYGPLWPVGKFVDELCDRPTDFCGAVESLEVERHCQSWFRLFRRSAYMSEAFSDLMLRPLQSSNKWAIISQYEIGMSRRLREIGLRGYSAYSTSRNDALPRIMPFNPTYALWKQLIERHGVPFIKVDLLRDNLFGGRSLTRWKGLVRRHRPELLPLIQDDLDLRKGRWPRHWLLRRYDRYNRIYRPELRALIHLDDALGGRAGRQIAAVAAALMNGVDACFVAARQVKALAKRLLARIGPRFQQ